MAMLLKIDFIFILKFSIAIKYCKKKINDTCPLFYKQMIYFITTIISSLNLFDCIVIQHKHSTQTMTNQYKNSVSYATQPIDQSRRVQT